MPRNYSYYFVKSKFSFELDPETLGPNGTVTFSNTIPIADNDENRYVLEGSIYIGMRLQDMLLSGVAFRNMCGLYSVVYILKRK